MKIAKLKIKNSKPAGFALIYTLLFIVLLLIAVSATWFTGMADLRLARRTEYSTAAMQLAKAAIDDGWIKYKSLIDKRITYSDNDITFPTTTSKVMRINPNLPSTDANYKQEVVFLNNPPSLVLSLQGIYDYRISTVSGATTIEGIGYFKGNKITLKAQVTHNHGITPNLPTGCILGDPINPCTGLDHGADYLTIQQTGPSK